MAGARRAGLVSVALAVAGCLEAPPGAGGEPDGCNAVEPLPPDPTVGDVLTYTFDHDRTEVEVVHDESGNRLDGALEGSGIANLGQYGQCAEYDASATAMIEVPSHPLLHLGNTYTIELWVWRTRMGSAEGLVSVYDEELAAGEYAFEIAGDDGLLLAVSEGCDESPVEVLVAAPGSALTVEMGRWIHVAVAWDGEVARFYKDGVLAYEESFDPKPCEMERSLTIGGTTRTRLPFEGSIDDVKISSWAKNDEEIRASKDHDSSLADPRCGNRLVEPGETCEPPAACCNPATCQFAASTCACADCYQGGCVVEEPGRVEDAVVALYDFEEGEGTMVQDSSGSQLELSIIGTDYTWGAGSLRLGGTDAVLQSMSTASLIVEAVRESDAVSVEVWFTPLDLSVDQQFLASLAFGDDCLGFALTQDQDRVVAVTGTDRTPLDGEPGIDTPDQLVDGRRTHVVLTRDAAGLRRLYVDGRLRGENLAPGTFLSWDLAQRLALGGPVIDVSPDCEAGESAFWKGELHRVAVHARALDELEVARNFAAGPQVEPATVR